MPALWYGELSVPTPAELPFAPGVPCQAPCLSLAHSPRYQNWWGLSWLAGGWDMELLLPLKSWDRDAPRPPRGVRGLPSPWDAMSLVTSVVVLGPALLAQRPVG